ncbi:MAG: hypothetical protein GY949_05815 [Gammaproteobacteria bacterium]|nr:hypothetical protein [Gammaproteobacteria bacterium]
MTKEIVHIEGNEFVVGPSGCVVDLDGNVCGLLNADLIGADGEDISKNAVDTMVTSATLTAQRSGAKSAGHVAHVAHAAYEAGKKYGEVLVEKGKLQKAWEEEEYANRQLERMERIRAQRRKKK